MDCTRQRLREMAYQITRLQIQFRGQRAQYTRTEECVQLFTVDGLADTVAEPRPRHGSETQLFHPLHDAINGSMSVDEIVDGAGEFFACQLAPQHFWNSYPSLHGSSLTKQPEKAR